MKNKEILFALTDIDPKLIEECENQSKKRGKILRYALIAAVAVLLVCGVVAGAIIANRKAPVDKPEPTPVETKTAEGEETTQTSAPATETTPTEPVKRTPQQTVKDYESGLIFALNDDKDEYTVIGICDPDKTEIVIPESYDGIPITTLMKENLVEGTDVATLVINKYIDTIYAPAFFSEKPLLIAVNNENPYYYCAGNCLIDRRDHSIVRGFAFSEIPDDGSVTRIGAHAFEHCHDLTKIVIPESITVIDYQAFSDCTSLSSVTLPKNLTEIWGTAFSGCTSLKSIELPAGLKFLDWGVFSRCTALEEIVLPDKLEELSYMLFCDCTALRKVTLGAGIKNIHPHAFVGCTSLNEIVFNDGLLSIDHSAFVECDSLPSIRLPASIKSLAHTALFDVKEVFYAGTMEEWSKIVCTDNGKEILYPVKVIHCSDGDFVVDNYSE